MEKKIYKAPKMNVLQMKIAGAILESSLIDETPDYEEQFNFNFNPSEHNRQA